LRRGEERSSEKVGTGKNGTANRPARSKIKRLGPKGTRGRLRRWGELGG